jgi:O-antigen/teichoic acid export membrane protein
VEENLRDAMAEAVRGSIFLMSGNILSTAILSLNSILLARFLGPDKYGLYSLSLALVSLLVLLSNMGIPSFLVRNMALLRGDERAKEVASFAIRVSLLLSILLSLVGMAIAEPYSSHVLRRPDLSDYVRLAVLTIPFITACNLSSSILLGIGMAERSSTIPLFQSIFKLLISVTLVLFGLGVFGAIFGHLSGYIIAAIASFLLIRDFLSRRASGSLSSLLSYGLPLQLSSIMAAVVNQYTTLLLSSFTDFEIGNYYAAVTFSSVLGIVISSISSSLLSTFSRTLEGGIERMLKLSVKYSSLLIMPTTISLIIFSEDFVRIFFGSKYKLAPFYLSLLLLSYLPVSIGSLSIGSLLSSLGRTKIILIVSSLSYSIFLPLSYLLSNIFGVTGIIMAQISSSLVSVSLYLLISRNLRVSIDLKSSMKVCVASIFPAIPVIAVGHFLISPLRIILLPLYFFLYISLIPLILLEQADLEFLREVLSQIKLIGRASELILSYERKLMKIASDLRELH